MPAWQLTKVRSKSDLIQEAQREGRTVHFAPLMDIYHLKNSELYIRLFAGLSSGASISSAAQPSTTISAITNTFRPYSVAELINTAGPGPDNSLGRGIHCTILDTKRGVIMTGRFNF